MSIESPYQNEIRTTKLIILVEEAPFTNKYLQIELSRDNFKKVSDAIWSTLDKTIDGKVGNMKLREDPTIELPDDIRVFYD